MRQAMMKILVRYDPPPIPGNNHDFCAIDDVTHDEGSPVGYGATPYDAVRDLMDHMETLEEIKNADRISKTG